MLKNQFKLIPFTKCGQTNGISPKKRLFLLCSFWYLTYIVHKDNLQNSPQTGKIKCPACNKSYLRLRNLRTHYLSCHTNITYICHKCTKSFNHDSFERHNRKRCISSRHMDMTDFDWALHSSQNTHSDNQIKMDLPYTLQDNVDKPIDKPHLDLSCLINEHLMTTLMTTKPSPLATRNRRSVW